MDDVALSPRDLASVRQLLLALPEAGGVVLPGGVVDALSRLLPCDAIGAVEVDPDGYVLRGFDEPGGVYDHLGTRVCDGPVPTGFQHLLRVPDDDPDRRLMTSLGVRDTLRLGFTTPSGTVAQLYLDRHTRPFTGRDVLLLRTLEPLIEHLLRSRPRLAAHQSLSAAEHRVLELVATGASNRAVAEHLGVSVATVRKHLEHAYRKLEVGTRTAAVARLREPVAT